jgi:hypothetical protein
MITGKAHSLDMNITFDQLMKYHEGSLIQDAFPNLPADQREYIKTGITPEEWLEAFGEDD